MSEKKAVVITIILLIILSGIVYYKNILIPRDYKISDINIYRGTPAWQLAKAVENQNTVAVKKIITQNPKLLNYQEPKYGSTLLFWAVGAEKYNSAEMLLKCGADPDLATIIEGKTPLFLAAGDSWVSKSTDPKYVELLLKYGADPNRNYIGNGKNSLPASGTSPLMNSINDRGIEKTEALVDGGADINYQTIKGNSAVTYSLAIQYSYKSAYYLIVQKKAKVTNPIYSQDNPNNVSYPVNELRQWIFKLDSDEYKIKMEIVDEFSRQGVNYWNTKISDYTLNQIKRLYPDTWEEYLKKY